MRNALVVALSAAAVVLAACGGTAERETGEHTKAAPVAATQPQDAGPTRAEFIAKADEVCRQHRNRTTSLMREIDQADTLAQLAPLAARMKPLAARFADELDELQAPIADESVIDRYRSLVRRHADAIAQFADALADGAGVAAVTKASERIDGVQERYHGIAEGYGFKVCGRD